MIQTTKRAQEDKLGDKAIEEPYIVPIDHDKEVSHNTGPTTPAKKTSRHK